MTQELLDIVKSFRGKGIPLTDEDANAALQHCYRKMEVAGIKNPEEYLPLLFEDELKHSIVRNLINAVTGVMNCMLEVI